jgi:hypothetical protein
MRIFFMVDSFFFAEMRRVIAGAVPLDAAAPRAWRGNSAELLDFRIENPLRQMTGLPLWQRLPEHDQKPYTAV